jgi:ABC-2 type transport system permease protein
MTATLTPTTPISTRAATTGHPTGSIFPGVLRSEWTKFRSVRSTYWTLLAAVIGIIGLGALLALIFANQYSGMSASNKATFNPTSFSLAGVTIAEMAIGVLGALVITTEYKTGMIRSSLSAVPQRRTLLMAKAAVFGATTAVVSVVSCFIAFFLAQAILSGNAPTAHIGDPGVLRSIIGAGLYLPVLGLIALGIGTMIRHSAGAIAAFFGMILVLPTLVLLLPGNWANDIGKFLPSAAGHAIIVSTASSNSTPSLSPWIGFGVFCLYAVAALVGGAVMLQRRDA